MLPPVCVLRFLLFCSPICLACLTVTFRCKFYLFTLLYLATKDCTFENCTLCGVTCLLNIIFCLGISMATYSSTTHYFFQYRFCYFTDKWSCNSQVDLLLARIPSFVSFCFYVYHLCTKHRFLQTVFFSF